MSYKKPEYHLETADGRQIFFHRKEKLFLAYHEGENKFDILEEATIKKGPPPFSFPEKFMRKEFSEQSLPADIKYERSNDHWNRIKIYCGSNQHINGITNYESYAPKYDRYQYYSWNQPQEKTPVKFFYTKIDGGTVEIDEQLCRALASKCAKYNDYMGLHDYSFQINGESISFNILAKIIGENNVVTFESLNAARAKGELEPKVWLKYTMSFENKGTKFCGVVDKLTEAGAALVLPDGNKKTVAYGKLTREAVIQDESYKALLSETVQRNFQDAASNLKLYKARIAQRKLEIPMFSGDVRDCRAAHCPNCEMLLASTYGEIFICAMCNQRAALIEEQGDVGLFALAEKPSKNQFAVEESQCCNNCDLFHFSSGRHGKRSTGYCQFSNQCVMSHNWCKKWMPVEPSRYSSALKQHVTNLGFGVEDYRNTERRDKEIDDMVYKKEDHEKQKDKATKLKGAYSVQYGRFREELSEKAKSLPIVEIE